MCTRPNDDPSKLFSFNTVFKPHPKTMFSIIPLFFFITGDALQVKMFRFPARRVLCPAAAVVTACILNRDQVACNRKVDSKSVDNKSQAAFDRNIHKSIRESITNHLGSGAHGGVYKAVLNGLAVAYKTDFDSDWAFNQEKRNVEMFNGKPGILKALGYNSEAIVYELADCDLEAAVRIFGPDLLAKNILTIAIDLLTGLSNIHSAGCWHGDVQSANLLLKRGKTGEIHGLVGDLGMAGPSLDDLLEKGLDLKNYGLVLFILCMQIVNPGFELDWRDASYFTYERRSCSDGCVYSRNLQPEVRNDLHSVLSAKIPDEIITVIQYLLKSNEDQTHASKAIKFLQGKIAEKQLFAANVDVPSREDASWGVGAYALLAAERSQS